jgi:type IV secretory pathway VirD2 relaxase
LSDDFEPRLGRSRRDTLRPKTQLQRLAAQRLKRNPRTFGCRKFAPGEIFRKGRGKGAAAVARHWAHVSNRRVIVRSSTAPARGANTSAFSSHIRYLLRYPTDEEANRGRLYSGDSDNAEASEFNKRSRHDPWQFRFVVAPEDSHQIEDMSAFTRRLMQQVERDLGTPVDWVAANHFNTAHPHTHIVVRGRTPAHEELLINRRYMISGMRHRAEEIVTNMLGPKNGREVSVARQIELSGDRLTSIDQHISRSQTRGTVRVGRSSQSRAAPALTMQVKRLQYLEKLGLAEHVYGREWRLQPGWQDALKSLGRRTDTLAELSRAVGDERSAGRVEALGPAPEGKWVTGRLAALSASGTGLQDHLLVIDGLDGRIWLAQATSQETRQLPSPGGVISALIEPAPAPRAGARPNRTEPDEAAPDGQTIRTFVNSWLPVNQLIDRQAFTWLDELSDDQIALQSSGFGAEVRAAKSARQAFLAASSLDLSDFDALRRAELGRAAASLAGQTGKRYAELQSREVFRGEYNDHVDTAYGRFAVIASETRFTFTAMTDEVSRLKGKTVLVEQGPLSAGTLLWRSRGIER